MSDNLQQFVSSHGAQAELTRRRCDNHANREAAARCPQCKRYFCRECVTEHDGRVICADCLAEMTTRPDSSRWSPAAMLPFLAAILGLLTAWMAYYYLGLFLLDIPHEFHEGTIW